MKRRQSALSRAAGLHNWRRGHILSMIALCKNLSYDHQQEIEDMLKEELRLLDYDYEGEMRRIRARGR